MVPVKTGGPANRQWAGTGNDSRRKTNLTVRMEKKF